MFKELYYISSNEVNLDVRNDILDQKKSIFSMMMPSTRVNHVQQTEVNKQLFKKDLNHKTFKKVMVRYMLYT